MDKYTVQITKNGELLNIYYGSGAIVLMSNVTSGKVDFNGALFGLNGAYLTAECFVDIMMQYKDGPKLLLDCLVSKHVKGEIFLESIIEELLKEGYKGK